jgi:hypothetical protein
MPTTSPRGVEQRTTGVAGIDRDIRLDERHVSVVRQRTGLGTDDAGGGGVLEAEGRADRQHRLADLQLCRSPRRTVGRLRASMRITATSVCGSLPTTFAANSRRSGSLNRHLLRAIDHMGVGEDHAVGADDEARALAADHARALGRHLVPGSEAAEELVEGIVRRQALARSAPPRRSAAGVVPPVTLMLTTAGP